MSVNKNCLSFWLPKLLVAGLPVPRTEIVQTDCELSPLLDGMLPVGHHLFITEITAAAERIGFPAFLRTGQGSGKHEWKNTCYLASAADIPAHVAALVNWSHTVDFFGLAHDVWCVRELLPVEPVATLPRYGDMPLVAEVRAFVRGGEVVCSHGYWPEGAIAEGMECGHGMPRVGYLEDEPERCARCAADASALSTRITTFTTCDAVAIAAIAQSVALVFAGDGAWSVDLLKTQRGWFVTDMAEAHRSYHAEGCPHAVEFKRIGKGGVIAPEAAAEMRASLTRMDADAKGRP